MAASSEVRNGEGSGSHNTKKTKIQEMTELNKGKFLRDINQKIDESDGHGQSGEGAGWAWISMEG